ncbi:SocA family protein [Salmonella enterica]|nr:SocA family protein [Salmonella enterica]
MAAYLLSKSGKEMAFVKLMKLLYLSDRKSLENYGYSISGDRFYSMNLGPVLSQTYSLERDGSESTNKGWDSWIMDLADHKVALRRRVNGIEEFDELSRADIMSMDTVFQKYGHWEAFSLCWETHRICKEWQDPHGSSIPIPVKDIFIALGKDEETALALASNIAEHEQLERVTEDLR